MFGLVESTTWKKIWETSPVILQDLQPVHDAKSHGVKQADCSQNILSMMNLHLGPSNYEGIDSSVLLEGHIEEFCDLVTDKALEELVLLNC